MKDRNEMVLIVDDEPDMCWTLANVLRGNGFLSKQAQNGKAALALVKQNRFRLAFLDAKLPDIEGLELAQRIRSMDPSVRIVIVSGYFYKDDIDVRNALAEELICGFIAKPFNHDEILKAVENANTG